MSKEEFNTWIIKQIDRKNNKVTYDDTPTTTYILYVDNIPVGYICLRTEIDDNWKKWSGNFYYKVRSSERRKGYATKMLSLALDEFKKFGYREVLGNSSNDNIASSKVIENNGGILLKEIDGSRYYKIKIN